MYRNKQCSKCRFCEKDVQIDMGCTMDICKVAEKLFGCWHGIMCQEWKAIRNKEPIIEKECPNFLPKLTQINIKSGFKLYYQLVKQYEKEEEAKREKEWQELIKKYTK